MSAVKTVEVPIFIKKKHELADLLKAVERGSKEAVDLIVDTMNAADDKVSLKTKLECAKLLIEVQIKVSTEISRDTLNRQIAEIKANGLKTQLVTEDGPKRLPPRTDFSTIQEI